MGAPGPPRAGGCSPGWPCGCRCWALGAGCRVLSVYLSRLLPWSRPVLRYASGTPALQLVTFCLLGADTKTFLSPRGVFPLRARLPHRRREECVPVFLALEGQANLGGSFSQERVFQIICTAESVLGREPASPKHAWEV